jgi:uncharacterized integral membrane protein
MVMKMRKVDRRRFKSTLRETRRRKREYFYSAVTVLVVKIILLVFLCILFYTSATFFYYGASDSPAPLKLAIPAMVLVAIIILTFYIYKNIKDIREEYKNLHQQK